MTVAPMESHQHDTSTGLKIGSVPYLNAKPLTCCLDQADLTYAEPTLLAKKLRNGEINAGLVPLVEALEVDEYEIVDGVGICSRGPVYSVILVHKKPLKDVKTVLIDPASRTSSQLVRLILKDFLKKDVTFTNHPPKGGTDAELIIGDRAVAYRRSHPKEHVIDLGAAWQTWTRTPFVYAVWTLRPHPQNKLLADTLREAARVGMTERAAITDTPEDYRYLTKNIHYALGAEEKHGIQRFAEMLTRAGVLDKVPTLKWV